MLPHSLTNFEMEKNSQSKLKFDGVYSRNNLTKIKDWVYVINLDEYKSIDSFGIELFQKKFRNL